MRIWEITVVYLTTMLLAASLPCEAIKRGHYPRTPLEPVRHLAVIFVNDSGSKVRAELTPVPTSNSAAKLRLPEKRWIGAFREAKFVTGRTNEVLQFALFRNGKKLKEQSFGPFQEDVARKIRWNGTSLFLERKHKQQDF